MHYYIHPHHEDLTTIQVELTFPEQLYPASEVSINSRGPNECEYGVVIVTIVQVKYVYQLHCRM